MIRWRQAAGWRLAIVVVLLLFLLSGCSGGSVPQIEGRVEVVYGDEVLVEATVQVDQGSTAHTAIMAACQEQKLAYVYAEGMFDGFGGYASTNSDGWLLYADGALTEVGAGSLELQDGFELVFSYVNYDEAFAE